MNSFYGFKLNQTQVFNKDNHRLVVTNIKVDPITIIQLKTHNNDGYQAVQCGIGSKSWKSTNKPQKKLFKQLKLTTPPQHLREISITDNDKKIKPGDQIKVADIFSKGDNLKITGITKGRGFAGGIKRWGFSGGPRTHGQRDNERAIGSIGQGTNPGRVWKGKKMPGHYGHDTDTITGLKIFDIKQDKHIIQIIGTIPGHRNGLVQLIKVL